jgi:RNA polymerase sigma-70 factor (ECF subfamily)
MMNTGTDSVQVLRIHNLCRGTGGFRRLHEVLRTAAEYVSGRHLSNVDMLNPIQEDLNVPETGPTLSLYVTALRRYAMALAGDRDEADDLVQECLTRAIARTKSWSQIRNVRAYLFTILHNVFIDKVARGRPPSTVVPLDVMENKLFDRPQQEDGLRIRDLERALRVLPDDYRQVVLLVGLEGMSYRETAATLGIPLGTVMSRLSRGREALRQAMSSEAHGNLRMVK